MKTLAQMVAMGYERVRLGKARILATGTTNGVEWEIGLSTGVNGWGQEVSGLCVWLHTGRMQAGTLRTVDAIPIPYIVETIADIRNRMGDPGAFTDFARTTDITNAVERLRQRAATLTN